MIIAAATAAAPRDAAVADREATRALSAAIAQRAEQRRNDRIQDIEKADQARADRREQSQADARIRGDRLVDVTC